LNLDRVGYLGGVGFLVVLDEMVRGGQVHAGETLCGFAEESSKWMAAGLVLRSVGTRSRNRGGGRRSEQGLILGRFVNLGL